MLWHSSSFRVQGFRASGVSAFRALGLGFKGLV